MRSFIQVFFLMLSGAVFFPSCDEGIQPPQAPATGPQGPGFSGTITYKNWPPADSLLDLRLVAFRQFPPTNILEAIAQGAVYPPFPGGSSLPFNVDTTHYFVPADTGKYQYVVVAQQFGPNVFQDWRAVGQYDLDTNLAVPSPIVVPPNNVLQHIDITVDFSHHPPQPF